MISSWIGSLKTRAFVSCDLFLFFLPLKMSLRQADRNEWTEFVKYRHVQINTIVGVCCTCDLSHVASSINYDLQLPSRSLIDAHLGSL
jgi:hypothetical protein